MIHTIEMLPRRPSELLACCVCFLLTNVLSHGATLNANKAATTCDFETTAICGFTQDRSGSDVFDWTTDSDGTSSSGTGPTADHTLATATSHYMYIEGSAPRRPGDRARLYSPLYTKTGYPACVRFWYHMYGSSVGTLNVYVALRGTSKIIWTKSGNQGNRWLNGSATVPVSPDNYQIVFEGIRGQSYTGDIAIDDYSLSTDSSLTESTVDTTTETPITTDTEVLIPETDTAITTTVVTEPETSEYQATPSYTSDPPVVFSRHASMIARDVTTESELSVADTTVIDMTTENILQPENSILTGCQIDRWNIKVDTNVLRLLYPDIRHGRIYLGVANCLGKQESNLLVFQQSLQSCDTKVTKTNTSFTYHNELYYVEYDPSFTFIIRRYIWDLPVTCLIPQILTANVSVHHEGHHLHESLVTPPPEQSHISLSFFKDSQFMFPIPGPELHINVGDLVYVKVVTTTNNTNEKLALRSCYMKPTADAPSEKNYYIIKNGCAVDPNTHIITRSLHESRFYFQEFEYSTNHEGLKIYCEASLCDVSDVSPGCVHNCVNPALIG